MTKTCKKHQKTPVLIVDKCPACEIEMYRAERNKYKKALEEIANQHTPRKAFTVKHDDLVDKAQEALKDERAELIGDLDG
tara:strand:+ start:3157 stop:3396 length:240 start_codon:yes stop_codon:yes gene_type:complete